MGIRNELDASFLKLFRASPTRTHRVLSKTQTRKTELKQNYGYIEATQCRHHRSR